MGRSPNPKPITRKDGEVVCRVVVYIDRDLHKRMLHYGIDEGLTVSETMTRAIQMYTAELDATKPKPLCQACLDDNQVTCDCPASAKVHP